jgi:capsular exopolysaccharide synthesis family protein
MVTLLVTMVVVIAGTLLVTPVYSASTVIRIATAAGGSIDYYDYMYADRLMNTYVQSVTSIPTLNQLTQLLQIQKPPQIKAEIIPNTELIRITVEDTDPIFVADVANDLSNILISQSDTLYSGGGKNPAEILNEQLNQLSEELAKARSDYESLLMNSPGDTEQLSALNQSINLKEQIYASVLDQYDQARVREALRENMVTVFEQAEVPKAPTKPNRLLNISLGLIVGLIGGFGLAFLFENLDTTLNTTDQIEAITKLPSIGKIPQLKKTNSFNDMNNNFAYGESFRRLRTNILSVEFPMKTLLITSAEPREGKSRIIANLAYAMAQSGRNVVVVDGDFRLPSQHKLFNIGNKVGLSSVLHQKSAFKETLKASEFQGVRVLPSGPLPINPSELLGSDYMKTLINQLANIFDLVIIDAPAALAVTDAAVIAPMVDAVALVILRGKTSARAVQSVLDQLNNIKARWIGVIVNQAEMYDNQYYYRRKKASSTNNIGTI